MDFYALVILLSCCICLLESALLFHFFLVITSSLASFQANELHQGYSMGTIIGY